MMRLIRILALIAFYFALEVAVCSGQNWSTFLDPSRAITWNAGFAIPNYTVPCATQPTLTPNSSGADTTNANAIMTALASCDATHNVVSIPAGTFYVAGFHYGTQGKQVLRGAGANQTFIISTSEDGCGGPGHGVCMIAADWTYSGNANALPGGSNSCNWTAGYAQGTTSITLNGCGTNPSAWIGRQIILDQGNDSSDTGGVLICNASMPNCTYDSGTTANGRIIGGVQYSMQQVVIITAVSGTGPYTVTISPGVYATNIRSGKNPGAWYPGFVQNLGLENLSVDGTLDNAHGTVSMFSCYQCWVKGVRLLNGNRNSIYIYQSAHGVIRDSYFYGAQSSHTQSYNIEADTAADYLVENNIMQQVTTPMLWNGGVMGFVAGYNYTPRTYYNDGTSTYNWPYYASHDADDNFNLFEGNVGPGISADNSSGPADQVTMFRNMFTGWESGTNDLTTIPVIQRANNRAFNYVGNVLGQPSYHTGYQTYALTGSTISGGPEATDIYSLGLAAADTCTLGAATTCDILGFSTTMRWGNYSVVTAAGPAGVTWDSTEASPAAVTYVNANFTSSYFGSLAHTLPASLYYSATPSWWTTGKNWPPIGPDVSSGNVGICTGTYAGSQATSSSQCTAGTLSTAWGSHVTSIPAQDCFLSLGGKPDGSGSALSFNASTCYAGVVTDPTVTLSGVTLSGVTVN